MSSRRNPFEELERMFDRMSRQFEEATSQWGESDWELFGTGREAAIDLVDEDDEFVVTIDVPGFERDEIELRIADSTLWVECERSAAEEEEGETYLRRERRQASMRRSVRLPAPVKPDEVTAKLKNGILTVTIPKEEPREESKKIEIEGA
ncbi:MAG TPA: archaeal heat shock protein Hsp14 [Halobacteriales archaeon]|nr:archaeal heat shock protein Hsp14 [Halobacteriales archaeon]